MSLELVTARASDGVRLDGSLAPAKGSSTLGIDAVILHHGVGSNFYAPSFFARLQEEFANAGCAAFRVNNRGHDIVSRSEIGFQGAAFELLDDSRLDWRAWLDVAQAMGHGRVLLWGHSLGGVKTAYFLANEDDERVVAAVCSSPPRFSYAATFHQRYGDQFRDAVAEAQALVDAGNSKAVFSATMPTTSLFSAQTYVDKYGPDENFNVVELLPRAKVPVLVTVGSLEGQDPDLPEFFSFGGLSDELAGLATQHTQLTYHLVDGADPGYTGRVDALWALAREWLPGAVGRIAAAGRS